MSASLSANGRFVAFTSTADNLSELDNDAVFNVYRKDLSTGAVTLVSRGNGRDGAAADNGSGQPAISGDGRVVAFISLAKNLTADDYGGHRFVEGDAFVRDIEAGTTTLVSRANGPSGQRADSRPERLDISASGRFVSFESGARNLSDEDNDLYADIFVRDLQTHTTTLVSRGDGLTGPAGDGESWDASISGDGRSVTFTSDARNFSGVDRDSGKDGGVVADVFVRDLTNGRTALVSRASGRNGAAATSGGDQSSISADGRHVAFTSVADNLSQADRRRTVDVYVRDLRAHLTRLASRADGRAGAGGNDWSGASALDDQPRLSGNGRFVAFDSQASNLSAADGRSIDVFLRDLRAGRTHLVSRATGPRGRAGNRDSANPAISDDGVFVAFDTESSNLSRIADRALSNVFVRQVARGG